MLNTRFVRFALLLLPLFSASASSLPPTGRYSVEFHETDVSCSAVATPEQPFTINFGPKASSGFCADNPSLSCFTQYSSALANGVRRIALDSPAICDATMSPCVEVMVKFVKDAQSGTDQMSFETFEYQHGWGVNHDPVVLPVGGMLNQSRSYVVTLDTCRFTLMNYVVTQRP